MTHTTHRPLSNATLAHFDADIAVPGYDRAALVAGIAHIGVGNFHRAHQARYVDDCLHLPDTEQWGICGIGLGNGASARAKAAALRAQDGLYSLSEIGPDGHEDVRIVGALIDYLHAPADPEAVLGRLADPAIRIVSLTITEGGYNFDEATGDFRFDETDIAHDLAGGPPRTAFGFIVEALRRRHDAGVDAFTVMSCDNLRQNGDTARRAVLAFAGARDPELANWIAQHVTFPNSMVDRIAPQVTPSMQARAHARTGDAAPVIAETFTQWVIEDRFSCGRPPFERVGVELCDDVSEWEAMKGRMLNASHMLLAYPALLLGHRLVHDGMADPDIAALLRVFMTRDVAPILPWPPGVDGGAYIDNTIERFGNAALADQLARVAHDGASKIPVFHRKTIAKLERDGRDISRAALLLACFQQYLAGTDDRGDAFAVNETRLDAQDWALLASGDPLAMLRMSPFVGLGLDHSERFVARFLQLRAWIAARATRQAIRDVVQSSGEG
ncbi:mannitol 2-dehydrogenase/sorbose reductase [Paraburkholderia tropica]|uniref:mannitol dehydrogenase family protein n=1 Tax=Paraburkholderia tropica TaxID=92647 RepID=UPI00161AF04E|nr:mannitol dehydrogenase family protein [Paraburkholderia tropica]MBB3000428.1 mannitol 2-dehydrogenase/sorbose reductase [Paraburkholderia tropica]MBB6320057.1 mannitol 2-dehydrogenase/sorbose reductase [Paraburkholderia tropica]